MADTLYLSLWYPNLQLASLADKLTAVLGAFAAHGGEARVYSATVWPVSWSETPVFQQVYGRRINTGDGGDAKGLATVDLIVPSKVTARIQEAHKFLFHVLCELVDPALKK